MLVTSIFSVSHNVLQWFQSTGSQKSGLCGRVNSFPNKPWFLRVCCTSLLKTLWEIFSPCFNSTKNKILDWSKLKEFADNKMKCESGTKNCVEKGRNILGKGENAGHQHFLLFPQCFKKSTFSGTLEFGIVW